MKFKIYEFKYLLQLAKVVYPLSFRPKRSVAEESLLTVKTVKIIHLELKAIPPLGLEASVGMTRGLNDADWDSSKTALYD